MRVNVAAVGLGWGHSLPSAAEICAEGMPSDLGREGDKATPSRQGRASEMGRTMRELRMSDLRGPWGETGW